jgi:hypothetical protein
MSSAPLRTLNTAVGELEYHLDSLNTIQLSIQRPENVGILVITLAVAAAK